MVRLTRNRRQYSHSAANDAAEWANHTAANNVSHLNKSLTVNRMDSHRTLVAFTHYARLYWKKKTFRRFIRRLRANLRRRPSGGRAVIWAHPGLIKGLKEHNLLFQSVFLDIKKITIDMYQTSVQFMNQLEYAHRLTFEEIALAHEILEEAFDEDEFIHALIAFDFKQMESLHEEPDLAKLLQQVFNTIIKKRLEKLDKPELATSILEKIKAEHAKSISQLAPQIENLVQQQPTTYQTRMNRLLNQQTLFERRRHSMKPEENQRRRPYRRWSAPQSQA